MGCFYEGGADVHMYVCMYVSVSCIILHQRRFVSKIKSLSFFSFSFFFH